MRKSDSKINKLITLINSWGVGAHFTIGQVAYEIPELQRQPDAKYPDGQYKNYRISSYLCYLKNAGFLKAGNERGTFEVLYLVPDAVTLADLIGATSHADILVDNENGPGYKSVPRKENYFDFASYFASCDQASNFTIDEDEDIQMPHSGGGTVVVNQDTKTIYMVNMTTGQITESEVMPWDNSYKTQPNIFDDADSAEAFAEGIVPPAKESAPAPETDLVSERVEELRESISKEDIEESQEFVANTDSIIAITIESSEEEVEEVEINDPPMGSLKERLIRAIETTLPFGIGETIFTIVKSEDGHLIREEEITEIEIELESDGDVEVEIETNYSEFDLDEYNNKFFTEKEQVVAKLSELL